jgi:hypothetical protein
MKKGIFLFISCFVIVFMSVGTALCQPSISNGSFDGTTTGWNNCGLGSDAVPEVKYSQECYDASLSTNCVQYGDGSGTDNNNCGTGCAGNLSPNYMAEVDQGNSKGLCQNVTFSNTSSRTLYLTFGRRTDARGGGGAADPQIVQVCIQFATPICTTFTRTSSSTAISFSTSAFTFTPPTTGTFQLRITNISTYAGPDNGNYGTIFSYIGFNTPTPVTLLNLIAVKNGSEVDIDWETATEVNNDYFVVEKSRNGVDFTAVGIVDGAGNSQSALNYQATDHSPYNGISYYRLKQVDYDGTISYSEIKAINFNGNDNIIVYPNPNTGIFSIQGLNGDAEISVQNPLGQVILVKKVSSDSSEIDLSGQPSGIYYITANDGETSVSSKIILHR